MALVTYPAALMYESVGFRFARLQKMGPETLGGGRQVFAMPPAGPGSEGRWQAQVTYKLLGDAQILAFRAFLAALKGMINYTAVPVCDVYSLNHASTANPLASAAAGAETLRFADTAFGAQDIPAGSYLQVGDWLHHVTAFDDATPGEHIVTLEPPLREAVTTSTVCTTKAACLMRLSSPEQGMAFLQYGRSGTVSLSFIEAFDVLESLA